MLLVGVGLVLAPEFLYMRDQFGWRMNTIFKFYFQAWILWGICAAYACTSLWNSGKGIAKISFCILSFVVLAAGLAYPFWAITFRLQGAKVGELSLDGERHMTLYSEDEANAIGWLKNAPYGVVAEAIGGSYSGYARVSTYSGMPTVLGWPGHESQWRGGAEEMGTRETDIRTLFQTSKWEEAREIIRKYNIRYIYHGSL